MLWKHALPEWEGDYDMRGTEKCLALVDKSRRQHLASTIRLLTVIAIVSVGSIFLGDGVTSAFLPPSAPLPPSGTPYLTGVSCTSTSFCGAVSTSGDAYNYDGTSWGQQNITSNQLGSISCTSLSFCATGDNAGDLYTWNGTSWSSSNADGSNIILAESCYSSTFCVAVDDVGNALTYNGTSWSSSDIDGTTPIWGVSCISTAFCVAVDGLGNALIYNGTSWSSSNIDSSYVIAGVSCVSSSFCVAVDQLGYAFTYNGTSWSSALADSSEPLIAVSCTSATFCAAVDDDGNAVTYNGSSWTETSISSYSLTAVSCLSSSFCFAVDDDGDAYFYDGSSWASSVLDPGNEIDAVWCNQPTSGDAPPSFCILGDGTGHLIISKDEFTQNEFTDPVKHSGTSVGAIDGVSCADSSSPTSTPPLCVAVSSKGYEVEWTPTGSNDNTLSTPTRLTSSDSQPLNDVSCFTDENSGNANLCWAVGGDGNVYRYSGTSWGSGTTLGSSPDIYPLNAISCLNGSESGGTYPIDCSATDNEGDVWTYDSATSTWVEHANVDEETSPSLNSVSCTLGSGSPGPIYCAAADQSGYIVTTTSYWSTGTIQGPQELSTHALIGVSCQDTDDCSAVNNQHDAYWTNDQWSDLGCSTCHGGYDIEGGSRVNESVDCFSTGSTQRCVAGASSGYVVTTDDTWAIVDKTRRPA